jgi:hypothetical protein
MSKDCLTFMIFLIKMNGLHLIRRIAFLSERLILLQMAFPHFYSPYKTDELFSHVEGHHQHDQRIFHIRMN